MVNEKSLLINNKSIVYFEHKAEGSLKQIVLFCHGFPGGNRLTAMAAKLNPHGINVVEANYRGDKACEGKFSFLGSVEDIKALTNKLRQDHAGVPITVLGFSAGGYYTLCIARENPNLFDKIVLLNPLLDLAFMDTPIMEILWDEAREELTLHDKDFYEKEITEMKERHNPINFVTELTPKINMVVSDGDEVLSPATAKQFYGRLPNAGKFVSIPDAQHSVRGDEDEIIRMLI